MLSELAVIAKIKSSGSRRLLKFHGFSFRVNAYNCFELSLFSDLMREDLFKFLERNYRTLSREDKLRISLRVAEGIEELQRLKIIHGDIKPQNILLDSDSQVFITDYGTSRIVEYDHTLLTGSVQATLRFAAPELLLHKILTLKVDLIDLKIADLELQRFIIWMGLLYFPPKKIPHFFFFWIQKISS